MALDGNSAGTNASISQTVSGLTIGKTYDLKFVWAGIQLQQYSGATTESLVVSFGNQSQSTQVLNEGTHDFSGWITQNMEFVATAASQTLTFLSIGTPGGNPPMSLLDGISLTEAPVAAVPEPSTYALMFGGLGLIGLSLNRRRKSSQVADRTVA